MLEPHAPLRAGEGRQPMSIDKHFRARLERNQAPEGERGDQKQDRGRYRIDCISCRSGADRRPGRGLGSCDSRCRHAQLRDERLRSGCRRRRLRCDLGSWAEECRGPDAPAWKNQRSECHDDERQKADMRDPRALSSRAMLHERQETERQSGDQQRLERDCDQNRHHLLLLALRARAIICSSSSISSSLSFSDIPRSALAALAGEPLKKTRTISLKADFLATVSDTTGL